MVNAAVLTYLPMQNLSTTVLFSNYKIKFQKDKYNNFSEAIHCSADGLMVSNMVDNAESTGFDSYKNQIFLSFLNFLIYQIMQNDDLK